MKSFIALVPIAILVAGPALAGSSGIPDLGNSYAECAYQGPGIPTVMVVPDGSGNRLDEAVLPDGTVVDATISLWLLDGGNFPIANFPFEDLWIEAEDGGLSICPGGTTADLNTDARGWTEFRHPFFAGGYTEGLCQAYINGMAVDSPPLGVNFNSPDIDGSLRVDLTDLGYFAADYYGPFVFRSDFQRSSFLDLSDLGRFASAYTKTCP